MPPLVAAKPIVTITGPTLVNAGETNDYLVTVTVKGGAGNTVGVNISSSGTSSLIGDGLSTVSAALLPIDGDLRLTGLSSGSLQKPMASVVNNTQCNGSDAANCLIQNQKQRLLIQASFAGVVLAVARRVKFQAHWIAPSRTMNKTVALFAAGVSTRE